MVPRYADAPTGVGLGLRASFMAEVDAGAADGQVPFFEISPENHMHRGGRTPARFARITERFKILSHGLAMSIGGPDPYDDEYFATLRGFLDDLGGDRWHSDHLCFCGTDGRALHDLLPVPFTAAMAARMADRVREAADRLGRPMLIENISDYMPTAATTASTRSTGCARSRCPAWSRCTSPATSSGTAARR
jgi:uncharacterized protein (UPF0276 family)